MKDKNRLDGLKYICKECIKPIQKENNQKYKDYHYEYAKKWRSIPENRDKIRKPSENKRQKKKDAHIYWSNYDTNLMYEMFGRFCGWCGKSEEQNRLDSGINCLDYEHFIAITKGGKTVPGNIYPCCYECNRGRNGKYNKDPLEWAKTKFPEDYIERYNYIIERLNYHGQDYQRRLENGEL
jgi:hypothetical protein